MKNKFVVSVVVSALLVMFAGVSLSFADNEEVVAQFSNPLSSQELSEVVTTTGIEPKEIYFQDGDIQGGYTLEIGESIYQAVMQLTEKHKEALQNMLEVVEEDQVATSDEDKSSRYRKLHKSLSDALNRAISQDPKINGVRVLNTPVLQDLLNSDILESIKPVQKSPRRLKENDLRSQNQSSWTDFFVAKAFAATYYVNEVYWAPRSGSSKTTQYMAYNSFSFPNASGFDSFGGIMTYEHETQVYNKNFADYDNYWSSNLPSAYYDTPFLDTLDNFTVGSSQASSILDNTQYWTYMSLTPGSSSTAGVIIKGQLGHRYPSWCYSTWCIYADMTTGWLTDYTAPISTQQSWTYNP